MLVVLLVRKFHFLIAAFFKSYSVYFIEENFKHSTKVNSTVNLTYHQHADNNLYVSLNTLFLKHACNVTVTLTNHWVLLKNDSYFNCEKRLITKFTS